jgi:hypothetical protein
MRLPFSMSSFWDLPIPGIALALLVGMLGAYELGILAHNRLRATADSTTSGSSDEGFILSGGLGLLALLMAFCFSMAVGRYENRRELMLTEANAISSFDLMAEAVKAPFSDQMRAELRPYASARMLASTSRGENARAAARQRAAQELAALETTVRKAMRAHEGGPAAVAIGNAFDAMSDAAANRNALAVARLPNPVLLLLAAFCLVSAAMLGYAVASERSRHRIASGILFLLLALAFGTVLDLDRPVTGAITVSQEPLTQTVRELR